MNKLNFKGLFRLFWMFIKVNLLSPSGPSSVGLLYKEAVGEIMSESEFVEAVGFSSVLPGSDALQLAMFVGYAAGGFPGMLMALLGAIVPPTILMFLVASALERFQREVWMQGFVAGMNPAVAALMVVVAVELFRSGSKRKLDRRVIFIAFASAIAFWFELPSPVVLIGAGIMGVILFGHRRM